MAPAHSPSCRLCGAPLTETLVDLGVSPPCESYLSAEQLDDPEPFYPLHVRICGRCLLVQLDEHLAPEEIFTEYAYFSSYSDSWVAHARAYAEAMVERLGLTERSLVVELASNDGYLLRHFVERGVPSLGVEPARNVAGAARALGIETLVEFFGSRLARRLAAQGRRADLLVANNVLAQVPALNDFAAGMEVALAPGGVATVEVPHLVRLIEGLQFDRIYHEHFSYFSLGTLVRLFRQQRLEVFDVEELATHGGSLRVFLARAADGRPVSGRVPELLERERAAGYDRLEGYGGFSGRVEEARWALLELLVSLRRQGKRIAGYGAPGKGNTLLNYCGIRTDLVEYTVDRNPYKQGKFLPGTRIPVYPPERIAETRPDYVLVLPWNLREEIESQLSYIRAWGGRLIVPIPRAEVLP